MPFDPQFALDTMLPLAEAAYDVTKLPARWKLVATIQPGDFGFVAISDNITAISFRGTEVRGEWLKDFDGIALPNRFGRGLVHQGFQDQYVALRASLLAALKLAASLHPSNLMWITGHSLGAALATLFASDTTMIGGFQRLTYTLAGPRVGWHDFAQWFEEWWGPLYRIVNEWDVVPHSPSVLDGYDHVGTEVLIDGGRPPEDAEFLRTAHNLELSYRPGIAKLLSQKAA